LNDQRKILCCFADKFTYIANIKMKKFLLLSAAACAVLPYSVAMAADPVTLPEVISEAQAEIPQKVILVFEDEKTLPVADNGELLKNLPGVSGSRIGGHGIEPFIRGQKQAQINLVDDGVYVLSGCPNRMDPPSSYLQLEGNDKLIVEKGYASVSHGPGGCGGTVRTERAAPVFMDDTQLKASISSDYNSNGNMRSIAMNGAAGFGDTGYVRANTKWKKSEDYEDGNGKKVRSGFENKGARIDLGFNPNMASKLKFGVQYDKSTDIRFAGSGMDTPETENASIRGSVDSNVDLGMFDTVKASAYASGVEHLMDTYTLRTSTSFMATDVETRSYGGKFSIGGKNDTNDYIVGFDARMGNSDAISYMGTTIADNVVMSYMWPDITMDEIGLYGENTYAFSNRNRMKVGLRYDYVSVKAGKENETPTHGMSGSRTANDLYNEAYGYGWSDQTEHNVGGLMRYEYDLSKALNVYGTLSRSVRTADATERGVAKNTSGAQAAMRWYGNPNIDPEKHHQIEIGTSYAQSDWSLGGSVYYNKVSDYILRDNAQGQDGILLSNNSDIYRNIDATLTGFEISGGLDITSDLSFKANAAYTHADNDEDNRPLAQIAPLEVGATLEYATSDWMAALAMRAAAKQSRADVGAVTSGQDIEKTGGYAVFDVSGKVYSLEPFEVSLGISNIFDKNYSNHLNRGSSFDNTVAKVNEPGRSFFVRVNAEF